MGSVTNPTTMNATVHAILSDRDDSCFQQSKSIHTSSAVYVTAKPTTRRAKVSFISVSTAETKSRRGCFPGRAASCRADQFPSPFHRQGACHVPMQLESPHPISVAHRLPDVQAVRVAQSGHSVPCKPEQSLARLCTTQQFLRRFR